MNKCLLVSTFCLLSLTLTAQQNQTRIKVDGVSAVIGDFVILESDIDKMILEMQSQGMSTKNVNRCDLLGK